MVNISMFKGEAAVFFYLLVFVEFFKTGHPVSQNQPSILLTLGLTTLTVSKCYPSQTVEF